MLAPWKKIYDKPRQHIKKQKNYFNNRSLSSQGYGFSSSQVWMWELDYKESWVWKNWCFWTVVLAKTLENPLDSKEIQYSSVQSLSCVRLFVTPWIAAHQASLSITKFGVHSDSRPSSQWCHPAISSSGVPFSFCLQSLPASGSFPMSQFFPLGAKVLEFQLQHQSFQWIFRTDFL